MCAIITLCNAQGMLRIDVPIIVFQIEKLKIELNSTFCVNLCDHKEFLRITL